MSLVNLVSGGLDSTLVGVLAREEGIRVYPLFIDYGQLAAQKEWLTCKYVHEQLGLPRPTRMDISGFGKVILSGLTSRDKAIIDEAFTPGRNLLLLILGCSYAFQAKATAVSIGLLSDSLSLFPDQSKDFIEYAEKAIYKALNQYIQIITPLREFCKQDVIRLAEEKNIYGTYSCHSGNDHPCGACISCLERNA